MAVILVVEDDVFIREIAELMIQDWGYHTLSASDVEEALLLLRAAPHIDALFTDIYLKNVALGGYELAQQALKLRPTLRVLYATAGSATDKMKARFVVGSRFLEKPYTPLQLQSCLATLLAA
jgi:CheY-like chemotaxis protein